MLEEILIAGHSQFADPARTLAGLLEERPNQLHVLVITDPGKSCPEWVAGRSKSLLHLSFDDVHEHVQVSGRIPPAREHLERVLTWADGKDRIVVACHAGVSRSAATASLIAARAWGVARALDVLRPGVHWPNPVLVRFMKEMFAGQRIGEAVEEWMDNAFRVLAEADTSPGTQDFHPESVTANLPPGRPG